MHGPMGESIYTKSVSDLVRSILDSTRLNDSLFEQATLYFNNAAQDKYKISKLQEQLQDIDDTRKKANAKKKAELDDEYKKKRQALRKEQSKQQDACSQRIQKVLEVCTKLLALCESEDWEKTQVSSAKLLGTLQMLYPGEGSKLAQISKAFKPAYKAVVALRLLDKLLADNQINTPFINTRFDEQLRYCFENDEFTTFQRDVAIPIIIAAIFQDVGLLHPDARKILVGEDGSLDEFRVLDNDERLSLLKINHQHTLDYVTNGLGVQIYVGNSKEERNAFIELENERLKFIRALLISAYKPKLGIGNLIKVPQIYSSFIFSGKDSYSFMDLPKACLLIDKASQRGVVSEQVAKRLLAVMGHFPQGYGISYIPENHDPKKQSHYEYAIVIGLNPENPYVPICRAVTRNLEFVANGQTCEIKPANNLYFPEPKKKLEKMSPERLEEILSKLASNFEERMALDLLPSYWNPHTFFSYKKMQNLWKKE